MEGPGSSALRRLRPQLGARHDDRHFMSGMPVGVPERLQYRLATVMCRTDGHVIGAGSADAAGVEGAVGFRLGGIAPYMGGFVGLVSIFRRVIDRDRDARKGHEIVRNRSRGPFVYQDDAGMNFGRFAPAVSLAMDGDKAIAA